MPYTDKDELREYRKKYNSQYYKDNKKAMHDLKKAYYHLNKDKNREDHNKRSRDYRAKNPELVRAATKRYREKHKEKIKAYRKDPVNIEREKKTKKALHDKKKQEKREFTMRAKFTDEQRAIRKVEAARRHYLKNKEAILDKKAKRAKAKKSKATKAKYYKANRERILAYQDAYRANKRKEKDNLESLERRFDDSDKLSGYDVPYGGVTEYKGNKTDDGLISVSRVFIDELSAEIKSLRSDKVALCIVLFILASIIGILLAIMPWWMF